MRLRRLLPVSLLSCRGVGLPATPQRSQGGGSDITHPQGPCSHLGGPFWETIIADGVPAVSCSGSWPRDSPSPYLPIPRGQGIGRIDTDMGAGLQQATPSQGCLRATQLPANGLGVSRRWSEALGPGPWAQPGRASANVGTYGVNQQEGSPSPPYHPSPFQINKSFSKNTFAERLLGSSWYS